jgi:hypothetical protein
MAKCAYYPLMTESGTSIVHCYSISQCKEITSFDEPVSVSEFYNPCENGFKRNSDEPNGRSVSDGKC